MQDAETRASRAPVEEEGLRQELAGMAQRFQQIDYFGVLGVTEQSGDEEIREARKRRRRTDRARPRAPRFLLTFEEVTVSDRKRIADVGQSQQRAPQHAEISGDRPWPDCLRENALEISNCGNRLAQVGAHAVVRHEPGHRLLACLDGRG